MTKATVAKYRPFINNIRTILDIPADTLIEFQFRKFNNNSGGFASERMGMILVRINNRMTHLRTLEVLFHELQHAKQIVDGRLVLKHKLIEWEGKKYRPQPFGTTQYARDRYNNQPWEQDAISKEKLAAVYFPGGVYKPLRQFLGIDANGTKFYKIGAK